MPDILHEVVIEAAPEKVYKALTEQAGLKAWWTQDSHAEPKVGAVGEFRFSGGQFVIKMKVTQLETERKVYWSTEQGAPDWAGTSVTWDLTPAENGTKVLLGHRDYGSYEGSYANTSYNWAWYLASLKQYLETGKGNPHMG